MYTPCSVSPFTWISLACATVSVVELWPWMVIHFLISSPTLISHSLFPPLGPQPAPELQLYIPVPGVRGVSLRCVHRNVLNVQFNFQSICTTIRDSLSLSPYRRIRMYVVI